MIEPARPLALDERILAVIRAWHATGEPLANATFERLALDVCSYQLAAVAPYARFAATLGVTADRPPQSWRAIPAVPASAFKDATLTSFDPLHAELEFHTSGTTAERTGTHYFERAALYDAALLAGFDRFMVPDRVKLRFFNLVPNVRTAPHSSLGYMIGHVSVLRGDGKAAWFLDADSVDVTRLAAGLQTAAADRQAICLAGTAFAFVTVLDAFAERRLQFTMPDG
ncbi:MAG: hypothetical protein ACREM8_06835, partial [Vulcanimicrobiaceae bacterium]